MVDKSEQPHIGLSVVGHVDAGKSTTVGHLLLKLGGMNDRDLEKLKAEANNLGKQSFLFAFFLDKQAEERKRGVTITCTSKDFHTDKNYYSIIDCPGHKDFIKNMISGASQADAALILVPASKGSFETSIAKGDHKKGIIQGQTRQHSRLCFLLGIQQVVVGINKMDTCKWSEKRYMEIKENVEKMLKKMGYKIKSIPFIPFSGFHGDNLIEKSDKAKWYKGFKVKIKKGDEDIKVSGYTLLDALNDVIYMPERPVDAPFRMPLSGVYKIDGVGTVCTGRVETGTVVPDTQCAFTPGGSAGKVFSIEMHHKKYPMAKAGDNVGINVKALPKNNMPKVGDCMYLPGDKKGAITTDIGAFRAQVFVQDHPGQLKPTKDGKGGFTPIVFVRTGRAPCQLNKIFWKQGKSTGKAKVENPPFLVAGDAAEVEFLIKMPLHVEAFKESAGLGRIAVLDSNTLIMLGKVLSVITKEEVKKREGKK